MRRATAVRAVGLALLALGVSAGSAGAAGVAAKDKVTFILDSSPSGIHTPFFAAQGKRLYEQENLEVTIQPGSDAADAVAKVAGGSADVGFADAGAVVVGRSRGAKVMLAAMVADRGLGTLYTYRGSGILLPKDIEGKAVADDGGSPLLAVLRAFAAVNRIDLSKVRLVTVAPAATIPTLLEKKADAMLAVSTVEPDLKARAAQKGIEIVALPFSDWGLDVYGLGLFTAEREFLKRPDVLRRWTDATMRAVAWSVEHPDEAVALFLKRHPTVKPELARAQWQVMIGHLLTPRAALRGIGVMTEEKMRRTRDTLAQHMPLPGNTPVNDLYTNELLPKLFPRLPAR